MADTMPHRWDLYARNAGGSRTREGRHSGEGLCGGGQDPFRSTHCVRHEAAQVSVPAKLAIAKHFDLKHGMTRQLLVKCAEGAKSEWTVQIMDTDDAPPGTVRIHTNAYMHAFVRCVWRISRNGIGQHISGTLFPAGSTVPKSWGEARRDPRLCELFGGQTS